MKIKIFAALSLIYGLLFFYGQKPVFKDKNFEKAILQNLDQNKNGILEPWEMNRTLNLFLTYKGSLPQMT